MTALSIMSIGAFTPGGLSVGQTMGSLRTQLKRFEELAFLDAAGEPIVAAQSPLPLDRASEIDRIVALASFALTECSEHAQQQPLPLLLCAPEPQHAAVDHGGVLKRLCAENAHAIDARSSRVVTGGHCAIFEALSLAGSLIEAGTAPACFVLGADSLLDGDRFDALLRSDRIKTSTNEDGFIPGEAGVCLLLGSPRSGTPCLATISGVAVAHESANRTTNLPATGRELASAARAALAQASLPDDAVSHVLHDASGDRSTFMELSLAMASMRLQSPRPLEVHAPASCTGDVGAAFGPLALAAAAFFLDKRVFGGPATLVLGTCDGPLRGAAVVTAHRRSTTHA